MSDTLQVGALQVGARRVGGNDGHMTHDLVVVGGGPVGITMGLLAAHKGFDVVVVERDHEVYNKARAIGMDGEILRMFQGVGIADRIAAVTTPMAGAEFVRPDGEQIMGIALPPVEESPIGHPLMAAHYQPELERVMRACAVEFGVDLRVGTEVVSVQPDGDDVRTSISASGVEESLSSRWVVAADGASSGVRKSLGIKFRDLGFDQEWLVVDVRLTRDVQLPDFAQQICDPQRPTTYIRGHDRYRRWEFQLQDGESRDEMIEPGKVWELLAPWLTPDDGDLDRAVVYRFHATVAEEMREGSIFLAGDSAHQTPPFLGQGLNSGMRDAANLVWKLDAVRGGTAGDRLLDSYAVERIPHVTDMVAHACDTGRLIDQFAGRTDSGVDEDAAYGGSRPYPHLEHGVLTGDHPMVGRPLPQPRIDGELLDERLGQGWAIVSASDDIVTDAVREGWGRHGATFVGLETDWELIPFAPADGAIVVRPDRYVAAVVGESAALESATDELLAWLA